MALMDLIQARRSVRAYEPRAVERAKIERCLEAARLAPSANNGQPWRFVVVDQPELREKAARATFDAVVSFNRFVLGAPALVAAIQEPGNIYSRLGGLIKRHEYRPIDLGIAVAHFCLQAAEEGLGTCILGWFNRRRVAELLRVPRGKRVGLLIAVGYPADEAKPKKRKSLEEIRGYNRY